MRSSFELDFRLEDHSPSCYHVQIFNTFLPDSLCELGIEEMKFQWAYTNKKCTKFVYVSSIHFNRFYALKHINFTFCFFNV